MNNPAAVNRIKDLSRSLYYLMQHEMNKNMETIDCDSFDSRDEHEDIIKK